MRLAQGRAGWALAAAGTIGIALTGFLGQETPSLLAAPAASVQTPAETQSRLTEIKVELAWLADSETFPCQLAARVVEGKLEVGGFVANEALHQRALTVAKGQCKLPLDDKVKINPSAILPTVPDTHDNLCKSCATILSRAMSKYNQPFDFSADARGQVMISGLVPSLEEKLTVSRRLSQLPGCTSVVNNLSIGAVTIESKPMVMAPPVMMAPTAVNQPMVASQPMGVTIRADVQTQQRMPGATVASAPVTMPQQQVSQVPVGQSARPMVIPAPTQQVKLIASNPPNIQPTQPAKPVATTAATPQAKPTTTVSAAPQQPKLLSDAVTQQPKPMTPMTAPVKVATTMPQPAKPVVGMPTQTQVATVASSPYGAKPAATTAAVSPYAMKPATPETAKPTSPYSSTAAAQPKPASPYGSTAVAAAPQAKPVSPYTTTAAPQSPYTTTSVAAAPQMKPTQPSSGVVQVAYNSNMAAKNSGIVQAQAMAPAPMPKGPASAAIAPPPAAAKPAVAGAVSPQQQMQIMNRVQSVCGYQARDIQIQMSGTNQCTISLKVQSKEDGQAIGPKVLNMPELAPYKVDLKVDIVK